MAEHTEHIATSPNPADEKRKALESLFPEAISEGKIDLASLKRALGESFVIEGGERYGLNWAGKSDAYKVLQTPTTATLKPQRDLSVNFDDAQHVFIEGENLEVLKVLQKAYFGKVKLIYIDPPYNTGSDAFIYPDKFQETKEEYLKRINDLTDDGTLMREGFFRKNSKENGHFHSNWLSMMLPRLYIARNLLKDDGAIFVSCDDNEFHNLRCLMNEVFGEENFVASFVWVGGRKNDSKQVSTSHEYILTYAKNLTFINTQEIEWRERKEGIDKIYATYDRLAKEFDGDWKKVSVALQEWYRGLKPTEPAKEHEHYRWADKNGVYFASDISGPDDGRKSRPKYEVLHPTTKKPVPVPARGWRWEWARMEKELAKDRVHFGDDETSIPNIKVYLKENEYQAPSSVFYKDRRAASGVLKQIFQEKVFDFPKDHEVLKRLIALIATQNDIVLDFFSGSSSTAQAVLELNTNKDRSLRSICVQLPEKLEEDSRAYNIGYRTLADIGQERIRRVIERRPNETNDEKTTIGFKSFELSPSNFKQWRGDGIETAEELAQQMFLFAKGEKDGIQVEHVLYELLLKYGQELTTPIEKIELTGGIVFAIHERQMIFAIESFSEAMIEQLLALNPREIIAVDSVFQDSDELKTNLDLQCRDAGVKFTCI